MGERTLVAVLAHPDDESFGIGGTLARYSADGVNVDLVVATCGEAGVPGMPLWQAARMREAEMRRACAELGVRRLEFLGFADGRLSEVDFNGAVARLVGIFRRWRPDVVITFGPDGVTGHPDHVAVHRWTTEAFDRLDGQADGPRRLYYIVPSEATDQACGVPLSPAIVGGPMVAIDVGGFLVTKVKAMQQHRSQNPPVTGLPEEAARHLACHEVFRLVRPVSDDDSGAPQDDLFMGIDNERETAELPNN